MQFLKFILIVLVAAGAGYFGAQMAPGTDAPAKVEKQESVYERVMRTGKIRCGYAVWNPLLNVDPNTQDIVGLIPEMMALVGKKLELDIEWAEEASYGTIVEGLATGRYDVICAGLYRNAARSRRIDFTVPFGFNPLYVLIRTDETRIQAYDDLNNPDIKISVLEGEAGSIYARQTYPNASFVAIPQMSDFTLLYEEVAQNKADVVFAEMASYAEFNDKNPGKLKVFQPETPAAVYPVVIGLPQNDMRLKVAIDSALLELHNDGTIEKLLKKYSKTLGAFLPVAKPYEVSN